MHDPKYLPCGLRELRCEKCGSDRDRHVGTHRSPEGHAHWCWPCLTGDPNGSVQGALARLNAERKREKVGA
jgi:hypothetical protein